MFVSIEGKTSTKLNFPFLSSVSNNFISRQDNLKQNFAKPFKTFQDMCKTLLAGGMKSICLMNSWSSLWPSGTSRWFTSCWMDCLSTQLLARASMWAIS